MLKEGRFKSPEELAAVFAAASVDTKQPIITSCGTGVTASVLALALHHLSPASQVGEGTWAPSPCILHSPFCPLPRFGA